MMRGRGGLDEALNGGVHFHAVCELGSLGSNS